VTNTDTAPAPAKPKAKTEDTPVVPAKPKDWSWRHGPIIAPVNAGLGACSLGMLGDLAGVSPWWGLGAGLAGACGHGVRSIVRDVTPLGMVYRTTAWLGAGAWGAWALHTSAWSPDVLTALAAGTVALGLAAPEMADHETRAVTRREKEVAAAAQAESDAVAAARRLKVAKEWEARLDRVCMVKGALIQAVQDWPEGGGYTLQVRLPAGGMTWRQVASATDGLATDADLPHGCGVEVHPGKSRGVLLLKVATIDTTAEAKPYPIDNLTPLTFTGPLPVGMRRASVPASVNLLEDPMMIVGRRGSGKTVHLQVINAGLARCQDALIWHIDLNGAGMSSPWLSDFLAGQQDRPVIDWVAPTAAEAMLMVTTAVAIAKGRKVAYKQLMESVNDDKLPISAQVPAIVLVLDEGAEAVAASRGNTDLAGALDELISIARAARVQEVFSGLRATSETIPTTLKKQVGVKVQMRPEDIDEIAQLFGWHSGVSVEDAPYPGSGLLKTPDSRGILPFRGYDLRPDAIRAIARAVAPWRPTLDKPSAGIAGTAYANRWDRYGVLAHRPRRHHAHPENPRPVREHAPIRAGGGSRRARTREGRPRKEPGDPPEAPRRSREPEAADRGRQRRVRRDRLRGAVGRRRGPRLDRRQGRTSREGAQGRRTRRHPHRRHRREAREGRREAVPADPLPVARRLGGEDRPRRLVARLTGVRRESDSGGS
jgi:hypothetical protein